MWLRYCGIPSNNILNEATELIHIYLAGCNLHCDLFLLAARFLTTLYEYQIQNVKYIREGIR